MFAIIPYTPIIVGVIKDTTDKSHTFFTWFLYLTLDCITLFSGGKVRINMDPMVFGFAIGSLVMASVLFYQKRFAKCSKIEIVTMILIVICIIVWNLSGPFLALVSSISSEIIIGLYLIIQTFKYPKVKYNLTGYVGFFIVSMISLIFAKAFTIEEVGFAFSETILNILILLPLIKRWRVEKKLVYKF